jgi:hypothetical protein
MTALARTGIAICISVALAAPAASDERMPGEVLVAASDERMPGEVLVAASDERMPGEVLVVNTQDGSVSRVDLAAIVEVGGGGALRTVGRVEVGKAPKRVAFLP